VARALAAAAAIVVSLLAVSGAGGSGAQTPKRGGTVVVGTLREPGCINAYLPRCGSTPVSSHIMRQPLRGAFAVGSGFSWRPDLVSRAEFTKVPPYTLTYHIRPEARWSDGVPITARDFVFTHNALRSIAAELFDSDRQELAIIRSVSAVDAKTLKVVLRSRYAGWRGLFRHVIPRHALRGEDLSTVWLDRIHNPKTGRPIGSGPFLVERWERGRTVTFVRNPRYWGPHRAYLDRIVLRFCRQCVDLGAEQIEWLRARELDLAASIALSGPQIQELRRLAGVTVLAEPGPVWEHFDIRIGRGGHAALERKQVRQAVAYGIDRVAIARALFGTIDAGYPLSDSAVFGSGSVHYRPNWRAYRYRPTEARRLLEQQGCRRGADGIYVCGGERLSLRFVTTGDDPHRVQTLQLVQGQLRPAGIEARPVYGTRGAVFDQILESGEFDLVLFSYIATSPDAPAGSADLYGCGGAQNNSGYCQRLVTRDLDQARRILDEAQLARILNRADAQLAKDVPVIPLLERPLVAAFRSSVRNVSLRTRAWDPFTNAENWWLAD